MLGGTRSGKSGHAEGLLAGQDDVRYVATARTVPGLAGPSAAEHQCAPAQGFVPRSTRGLGTRSLRGWLARVNAYQPVEKPLISSFGNLARALAVI